MKIIEEFGINPILLLAQIVNFTILLLLLKRFLYKPILKILDERKEKIAKSLKTAEEIEKRLQKLSEEQSEIIEKAKTEAAQIVSEAKTEAKQLTESNLEKTKETINQLLEKNKERMVLEKEQMMSDARKELGEMVVMAAAAVTRQEISEKADSKLVKEALENITKNENK